MRDLTMAYGSFVLMRDLNFVVRTRRHLRHHGRQRMRQEHGASASDWTQGTGQGRDLLWRLQFYPSRPEAARAAAAALWHPLSERRALELDDPGGECRPSARRIYRPEAGDRSARSRRSSWRWWDSRASRISIRTKSAAACKNAPVSRARWRLIRRSLSSTSPRPASIRLVRAAR